MRLFQSLTYSYTLWGWGYNLYGQIGDGTGGMLNDERTTVVKVLENVVYVSAGEYNTFAIKEDGTLWGWGRNEEGQLGDGTKKSSYFPIKIMDDAVFVSQGRRTVYVVKKDNTLWEIGKNVVKPDSSQVGLELITPRKIMDNVTQAAEDIHATRLLLLKTDETVWLVGSSTIIKPKKVMSNVYNIVGGSMKFFAVKDDGSLWTFGSVDNRGRENLTPVKVMDDVSSISSNYISETAIIKKDGTFLEIKDGNVDEAVEIMNVTEQ